jgi:hypothetical protein
MKNLDKLYDLWYDLDSSFNKLGKSFNINNPKDFLRKISYNKEGKLLISQFKILLKDEYNSYNSEELEKYSQLIDILDTAEFALENMKDTTEIITLNSFIGKSSLEKSNANIEKIITEESILRDFTYEKEINYLDSKTMFIKYGEVNSFAKIYRGSVVCYKLKEDVTNDFIVVNKDTIPKIAELINEHLLLKRIIDAFKGLISIGVNTESFGAFCDKNLVENNTVLGRKVELVREFEMCKIYSFDNTFIVAV